jgi:hypothetical protein
VGDGTGSPKQTLAAPDLQGSCTHSTSWCQEGNHRAKRAAWRCIVGAARVSKLACTAAADVAALVL